MTDPSNRNSRAAALPGGRRSQMFLRIAVFVGVIAFLLLRPQFQEWFGDPNPANDESVRQQEPETSPDGSKKAPLGELKAIRSGVFESTAGLLYSQYRVDHLMEHAEDDLSKPVHGVFSGDRATILATIDEAFLKAEQGGGGVQTEQQGDRRVYIVDMSRVIGHVGGQKGRRENEPPCRHVQLVLENGNEVITAYPTLN